MYTRLYSFFRRNTLTPIVLFLKRKELSVAQQILVGLYSFVSRRSTSAVKVQQLTIVLLKKEKECERVCWRIPKFKYLIHFKLNDNPKKLNALLNNHLTKTHLFI